MNPLRSLLSQDPGQPPNSTLNKEDFIPEEESIERTHKLEPVTVYAVEWNLPGEPVDFYPTRELAELNCSEHHSSIREIQAVQDEFGNKFLIGANQEIEAVPISCRD